MHPLTPACCSHYTILLRNSLISKLKEADVGVMCRGQLISALLYADDAVKIRSL